MQENAVVINTKYGNNSRFQKQIDILCVPNRIFLHFAHIMTK